jgi:hypothetical protein
MRGKFAILLAIAAVCVTTAWAGWGSEQQITANRNNPNFLGFPNGHRIVVAANGVRHLVFNGYYKRYYPGSGWTPDLANQVGVRASIALDADGTTIHVVWQGSVGKGKSATDHVFYQKCVPGSSGNGGWVGTARDITPNGHSCNTPSVACYRDGSNVDHVAVTWFVTYTDTLGFCESVNGTWGAPRYFHDPSGTGGMVWNPSIAVDPQDHYGDVYISVPVTPPDGSGPVYVIRRHGGIWQEPENATPGGSCYIPSLEVNPSSGYPHFVCDGYGRNIYHTYWDPAGGWHPLELISDPNVPYSRNPNMFFSGGSAFVVWAETSSSSDRGVRYSVRDPGTGEWGPPAWVTSGYCDEYAYPSVTARSNGDVYVVWKDGRNGQIWGRLYTPGSFSGLEDQPATKSVPGIELFPNPAKAGLVALRYALPRAEPLMLTLLDVSGRAVGTQQTPEAGLKGTLNIDVSGLSTGVYVARLVARDLNISKLLVVER